MSTWTSRRRRSHRFILERLEERGAFSAGYAQVNLASDVPGLARFTDPHLVNPWGISFSPTGPFWFADNVTGVSDLLDGRGQPVPLVVRVPAADRASGRPTGTVFNGGPGFIISEEGASAPSRFLFAGDDGTISAWSEVVDRSRAIVAVDNSDSGAIYKGLALATEATGRTFLYAANFSAGRIDVFDQNFKTVVRANAFQDPSLPGGYAPFNIQAFDNLLYVTYARQDGARQDDVAGAGHGFIDVFDPSGELVRRFASGGALDSPWGLTLAPADFGPVGGALLVGNTGDGRINAFNAVTGAFFGPLADSRGAAITIPGLWAVTFGNGHEAGSADTLFFAAGPMDEGHGLFGAIQAPERRGADTAGSGSFDEHVPGEVDDYPLPPRTGPALQGDIPGSPTALLLPMKESSLVLIPTLSVVPEPPTERNEAARASLVFSPGQQKDSDGLVVVTEAKQAHPRADVPGPRPMALVRSFDDVLDVKNSDAGPRAPSLERPSHGGQNPTGARGRSVEFEAHEGDRTSDEPAPEIVSLVQALEIGARLTEEQHLASAGEPTPGREPSESRAGEAVALALSGLLIVICIPAVIYGARKLCPGSASSAGWPT